jgi:hypothetical protein
VAWSWPHHLGNRIDKTENTCSTSHKKHVCVHTRCIHYTFTVCSIPPQTNTPNSRVACGHRQKKVTAHDQHSMTSTPNPDRFTSQFQFRRVPPLLLCSSSCDFVFPSAASHRDAAAAAAARRVRSERARRAGGRGSNTLHRSVLPAACLVLK